MAVADRQLHDTERHAADGVIDPQSPHWSNVGSREGWWERPVVDRCGAASPAVPDRQVAQEALFLRRLLKGSLDTALGSEGFNSRADVHATIDRMVSDGSLVAEVKATCEDSSVTSTPTSPTQRWLRFPSAGPGAHCAPFTATLLCPLLVSHAYCTYIMAHALSPVANVPEQAATQPNGPVRSPSGPELSAVRASDLAHQQGPVSSEALLRRMQSVLMEQNPLPSPAAWMHECGVVHRSPPTALHHRTACQQVAAGQLPSEPLPSLIVLQQVTDALTDAGWLAPWPRDQAGPSDTSATKPSFGISVQSSINLMALDSTASSGNMPPATTSTSPTNAPHSTQLPATEQVAGAPAGSVRGASTGPAGPPSNIGGLASPSKAQLVAGKLLQRAAAGSGYLEEYLQRLLSYAWTGRCLPPILTESG